MKWHGCPAFLAEGVLKLWNNQTRHLSWYGELLPEPQKVSSSMPQGDGLSPRILNMILATPVKHIRSMVPTTRAVVFLDDRSWCNPTLNEFWQVLDLWFFHSAHLGLKENMMKNQYTHKQPEKRARMRLQDTFRNHTVDHLCALGAHLGFGKAVEKEEARIEKAAVCAAKVKACPCVCYA